MGKSGGPARESQSRPNQAPKRAPGHLGPEIEFYTETASQKMSLFEGLPFLGNLVVQPGCPNRWSVGCLRCLMTVPSHHWLACLKCVVSWTCLSKLGLRPSFFFKLWVCWVSVLLAECSISSLACMFPMFGFLDLSF